MQTVATRRYVAGATIVTLLLGIVIGAALMAAGPAEGATGDVVKAGQWNRAGRQTVFTANAGVTVMIRNQKSGGIPLELRSRPGTPPLRVTDDAKVVDLNADLWDGLEDVWRVAPETGSCKRYDGFPNTFPAAGSTWSCDMDTKGLVAAGTLQMAASVQILADTGGDTLSCTLNLKKGDGSFVEIDGAYRELEVDQNERGICSTHAITWIAEADDYTPQFYVAGLDPDTEVYEATAWFIFVPYPYNAD